MANRIRLGFIGANVRSTWASQSHFPALLASPDVELTAVCTTRRETAEAARKAFGAKLAFTDYREMVGSKEIDAVAVVVRVPSHYEPTKAAIEAGKHVYTEWPLGRTTAEAEELAALARAKDLQEARQARQRLRGDGSADRGILEARLQGLESTRHRHQHLPRRPQGPRRTCSRATQIDWSPDAVNLRLIGGTKAF